MILTFKKLKVTDLSEFIDISGRKVQITKRN